ncbi:sarcosine oxidase subunit delta [Rhodobacteraceae bacterium N5(2021)]|uniref:Sarcosine oxidase subunit delta n=1 Tax=Gymnodinialimonas phycosphaerae TaxID=2841589 RepID=A0A975TVS3_9RHOB|nr:sarcosine oxidase subunit delta [Gymnodinialimonas phycosphaerae]MBY4891340.1 sarcosine oxidase subunit delta [Gymnodinialimonas phycosphaerae]
MQLFPCPFCGLRAEAEFHFATTAGRARPEGAPDDVAWARYLYGEDAPKGLTTEIWLHTTCGEYFLLTRNSLTRLITGSEALR